MRLAIFCCEPVVEDTPTGRRTLCPTFDDSTKALLHCAWKLFHMSYTVLARRYRSGTFDEVIGQDHVAQTLKKAIESGRIAHAYLFCGTRGDGQDLAWPASSPSASTARSRQARRPSPAASATRAWRSRAATTSTSSRSTPPATPASTTSATSSPTRSTARRAARFKVYIIDEVHMLSKSAFNALLKTLEEPPEHVKFILATTEPEKVLPTILSRCQRYDFRNIPTREIAGHLQGHLQAGEDQGGRRRAAAGRQGRRGIDARCAVAARPAAQHRREAADRRDDRAAARPAQEPADLRPRRSRSATATRRRCSTRPTR